MGRTYEFHMTVKENRLDTFGHVNNATYLEMLEEARWEMMIEGGYGLEKVKATGLGPVILEIHIRYKYELGARTPVVIETQWIEYARRVASLRQRIVSPDRKIEYADAKLRVGLFDLEKRKLVRPTELWLRTIGILESSQSPPAL